MGISNPRPRVLLLPVDDNDDAEASGILLITFYSKALFDRYNISLSTRVTKVSVEVLKP